jgi:uncharacterized membrane protein
VAALANVGIDDDFVKQVRAEVQPGTALLLYTQHAEEGLLDDLKKVTSHPVLIQSNLVPAAGGQAARGVR